jgi:hypothetical protein
MAWAFRRPGLLRRALRASTFFVLPALFGTLAEACSLFTSFDGFTGGGAPSTDAGEGNDAVSQDAPGQDDGAAASDDQTGEQGQDATSDGGPGSDAMAADGQGARDGQSGDARVDDAAPGDAAANDGANALADAGSDAGGDAAIDTGADAGADTGADAGIDAGAGADSSTGSIGFVQVTAATAAASASSIAVTFSQAQSAGDTIVLAIGWAGGSASLTRISDSIGNGYASAVGPTKISAGLAQSIYYAKAIAAAAAGANTVTITLSAATTPLNLAAVEYSGLDAVSPLDVAAGFGGRGATTPDSTPVTTTSAHELIFGAGITQGSFIGAGAGYTLRKLSGSGLAVAEDFVASSTGSYSASAPLPAGGYYVIQVATFR